MPSVKKLGKLLIKRSNLALLLNQERPLTCNIIAQKHFQSLLRLLRKTN